LLVRNYVESCCLADIVTITSDMFTFVYDIVTIPADKKQITYDIRVLKIDRRFDIFYSNECSLIGGMINDHTNKK
jgi:hypothetical protein